MAIHYLVGKTPNVTVYHMFVAPRNNAGWPCVGGFPDDESRDSAMTRVSNYDIAWVRNGLPAAIKLDAFDYSIYGVLRGEVRYISPDALSERTQTGEAIFYRVHIGIDDTALAVRNRSHTSKPIEIQPGMTATVEIITGQQTLLAYLTKPVTKTLSESFGER